VTSDRSDALKRLEPLLGEWDLSVSFPHFDTSGVRARTTFSWTLDGQYLLQRAEVDVPEAPDLIALIDVDRSSGGYTQHYFDSRGVTRVYAMTFDGRTWTLSRETPDFSPLDFAQRFSGTLEDDGATIRARWDIRHPGGDWEKDFDLTYTRVV